MDFRGSFFSFALVILLAVSAVPAAAKSPIGTLEGMVVNVSDGDHITVSNNGTEIEVRLHGIHAPILAKINKNKPWLSGHGQPFAGRAFMALANKVLHKEVKLEIMHIDRHERAVAVIWVDGHNINQEMVAEGWAWACQKYKTHHNDVEYAQAEAEARSRKLGLWVQHNPKPPWEFRKMVQEDAKRGE